MECFPNRKQNRLHGFDYAAPGAYFVTVCTEHRMQAFVSGTTTGIKNNTVGTDLVSVRPPSPAKCLYDPTSIAACMIQDILERLIKQYPTVDCPCYAIMPDHVHLILILKNPDWGMSDENRRTDTRSVPTEDPINPSISEIMRKFKSWTTIEYTKLVKQQCVPPFEGRLWQQRFHDHIIRNRIDYEEILHYIAENPTKWKYTHP